MANFSQIMPSEFDIINDEKTKDEQINLQEFDVVNSVNTIIREFENPKISSECNCDDFVAMLIGNELNLNNYEKVFCLQKYNAVNIKTISNQKIHSIMYNDNDGYTIAIVQVDFQRNRMIIEFLSDILPRQEYKTPQYLNQLTEKCAQESGWEIEDGGINQFNGNVEYRYKNPEGNVMAAIISSQEGNIESIVNYKYTNGKRSQMINTGKFGQVTTVYDTCKEVLQILSMEIDSDGSVLRITKNFEN